MMKFFPLVFLFVLLIPIEAFSQECPGARYIFSSGIACTLDVKSGEVIKVKARYHEGLRIDKDDFVNLTVGGRVYTLRPGDRREIEFRSSGKRERVLYHINEYDDTDYVYVEAKVVRTNLYNRSVAIGPVTKSLILKYSVQGEDPFVPGYRRVCMDVHYGKGDRPTRRFAEACLDACVNQSRCFDTIRIPQSHFPAMNRGEDSIISILDPHNQYLEPTESDNIAEFRTKNNVIDNVRHIMRSRYGWYLAAALQERWLFAPPRMAKETNDFSGGPAYIEKGIVSLDWLMENAPVGSYINSKVNFLKNRRWYNRRNGRKEIVRVFRDTVLPRLGRRKNLPLSLPNLTGRPLANQKIFTQNTWYGAPGTEVYAAVGRFVLVSIPIGQAKRITPHRYEITMSHVGIYAVDSFEFVGRDQQLGWWQAQEDVFGSFLTNGDYHDYRSTMRKGGDFMIETPLKIYPFSQPITFKVRT